MTIRQPRNRERFISANVAADRLEAVARSLRSRDPGDLVHWEAKVWYWNEDWNNRSAAPRDHVTTQAGFRSGRKEATDEPT